MSPGDYWKDEHGVWFVFPPKDGAGVGSLTEHSVVEHDDGTISVSPSIMFAGVYHGFLERGVWREA